MSEEPFEFGNILFSGPCNQKCVFCIGNELESTPTNLREWPLQNIEQFVKRMRSSGTRKVILTGTRTDPLLYKHMEKLITYLRTHLLPGTHISIHTNGVLALKRFSAFNLCDSATISVNSFHPEIFRKIHGTRTMPDIAEILARTHMPIKLSCVVTDDNCHTLDAYLATARALHIKRIAIRHVYNDARRWSSAKLFAGRAPVRRHCNNPVYDVEGMEVTHWVFEGTAGRSLNLFSDGHLSERYLLSEAKSQQEKLIQ